MQQYIQTITRHFFRKDDLDQVAREELENFVTSYPYSSAGHLLLAKKLRDADPAAFNRQAAAASLYFTNPLWLHWMLDAPELDVNGTGLAAAHDMGPASSAPFSDEPILDEEAAPLLYATTAEPAAPAIGSTAAVAGVPAEEPPLEQSSFFAEENIPGHLSPSPQRLAASSETINEPFTSESPANAEENIPGHLSPSPQRLAASAETINEPFTSESPANAEENISGHLSQFPQSVSASSETINEPFTSESPANAEENIPGHLSPSPEGLVTGSETVNDPFTPESVANNIDPAAPSPGPATGFSSDTPEPEPNDAEADADDTEAPADIHIPGPRPDEQTELSIQSYHTIDYFASQGIRLRQEELLKDRFGQQVKSFTEWLRNMKRIGPPPVAAQDESSNEAIREIAAHSLHGKEVITEAMAEVWAKQGNREKAIGIYKKLSLLNPSKSAYFAAKIEQLKHNL